MPNEKKCTGWKLNAIDVGNWFFFSPLYCISTSFFFYHMYALILYMQPWWIARGWYSSYYNIMYLYKDYNCSYQLCITRESSIFDFGSWTCCVELLHGTGLQKIIDVGKPIKYLLFDSLMKLRNLLRGGHSRKKGIWYCRQTNMCFGSPQRRYKARLLTKFFVLNTCKQGTDVLS